MDEFWISTLISSLIASIFPIVYTYFNYCKDKKLEKMKHRYESQTYVTKKQYEKEFEIYEDLWNKLIECYNLYFDYVNFILEILPTWRTYQFISAVERKNLELENIINNFENQSSKLEPFYDADIYKKIRNVSEIASDMRCKIQNQIETLAIEEIEVWIIEDIKRILSSHIQNLRVAKSEACEGLREYLKTLKEI